MTEKRFELAYEKGNWWAVRDGDITLWKEEVVDLLNELHEENQTLKQKIKDIVVIDAYDYNKLHDENEQLEQFKNTVFDCINKKIEEVDTIGAEVLKDLRRELME